MDDVQAAHWVHCWVRIHKDTVETRRFILPEGGTMNMLVPHAVGAADITW